MAFWCRIKESKIKHLAHQLTRYYNQVPSLNYSITNARICVAEKQFWGIVRKPSDFCNNVRFFAAPVQPKKEEKDPTGPCLNDQIKAQFIRLVTEDGHKVVSRHEALALARKLNLDLVEVQRNAHPPVCKIMDFHREKYKKEIQEKDRAKAKSDVTLKKGACKEVRFSGKIEQKDLQMKADTVKRLMERGYRVKCMALPVGKKEEVEDLGGYLSRLVALIEDTSVIESGPHVERKQAYVIIRHVKFGPSKKGGGKKTMVVGDTSAVVHEAATLTPTTDPLVEIPSTAFLDSGDDFDRVFDLSDDTKGSTSNFMGQEMNAASGAAHSPANFNASNSSPPKPVLGFSRADTLPSSPPEPSLGTENRYKRSEPRNQFPQTRSMNQQGQGMRDSVRLEPQFQNQRRQPPANMQVSPSMGEKKQAGRDASVFRNTHPPNNTSKQEPSRPDVCSNPACSYGIFSNPNANAPRNPGTAGTEANQNIPGLKSDGSQRQAVDKDGQAKWGIFSR